MILGNVSQFNLGCFRKNGAFGDRYINYNQSTYQLVFSPDTTSSSTMSRASFPTGTQPPYSYFMPLKGGELSSTTQIAGVGSMTPNLLSGKFMTADLAGIGELQGSMSLITSMAANLAGIGSLSGDMKLTLAMAANLAGVGNLAGAMALLIPLNATLSGIGEITANLKGNADLQATIYVNQSEATTQQLVDAIWNAIAADYNTSGTMGQKLNGAGSAGDPWTTDLTSYSTPGTAGQIVRDNPAALEVINQNVKKASKLIPASTDI